LTILDPQTEQERRGFVLKTCQLCRVERTHLVVRSETTSRSSFIARPKTTSKTVLVCTACEFAITLDGLEGQAFVDAAIPEDQIAEKLRHRALGSPSPSTGSTRESSDRTLAAAMVAMALQSASADGSVEPRAVSSVINAIETIAEVTQSRPARTAAQTASADFSALLSYVSSPVTDPITVTLGSAGIRARELPPPDLARYIGQVAWLCSAAAAPGRAARERALEAMDLGFAQMGFTASEVADALSFCDAKGG